MNVEDDQVDRNYEAFRQLLPNLLKTKPGLFVLMRDEKIVDYFDTSMAAVVSGMKKFGAGNYSVQHVTSHSENLGFYSYAGGAIQA